jgi:DNA-directed RNA polymerase subunit RPC12/RpoP
MGLFKRKSEEPAEGGPAADRKALARQWQEQAQAMQAQAMQAQAMQAQAMQAQAMQAQAQAIQQAAALRQATAPQPRSRTGAAEAGSMTWVRQVLAILAPPQPGFVKRCSCVTCGAPKKLPTVTAYVYCDYCASLIDYDLRRACEGDTAPDPAYATTVNSSHAAAQAALTAGDQDAYRSLQQRIFEAYVTGVPMAVSHRARNDPGYRSAYVGYMAEAATMRAFDPASQALEAEMRQRVMGLRYSGNIMSPTVAPDSFWPMADTLERQIEAGRVQYRSAGLAELDPDHSGHLTGKFAWSGFCQGWLGMLPADAAAQLLDRAGLANEYVAVAAENGQPRRCGGCGAGFSALAGAKAIICEGCGRKMDLGGAEIPCAACGAGMTLPAGADRVACPFCQAQVERAGIR